MSFIESIYEKAKANRKIVAVPECTNERMMRLAVKAHGEGLAQVVFVGDQAEIRSVASAAGIDIAGIRIYDTGDEELRNQLLERYGALPKRAMGKAYVRKYMDRPLYMALVLEALGDVDVTYGGLDTTTLEFVMVVSGIIGLAPGVKNASGMAIVELMDRDDNVIALLGMADGAVNTEPTAEQLSGIAIASCDMYAALTGEVSRCAILSYSTDGSGNSPSVKREQEARDMARAARPDLLIDGEFQIDTALIPRVAQRKLKRPSEVAGQANVLVFPDAAAANIGSKLVQMYAPSRGYGPVYQGFAKPVLDCSRGASDAILYDNFAFCSVIAANQT